MHFTGDFVQVLRPIHSGLLIGSSSASYEAASDITVGDVRCATLVFERYSMVGNNRLSLTVTLIGRGRELNLVAITSGGSQAVFWKLNFYGEDAFLSQFVGHLDTIIGRQSA
ncbi:hypothetical protein CYJ73_11685 [Gordonia terrae]|uniref:Polyketide cyclase / dehydrase and lipid transport n=1 Tax=Gordonia terrae TaxID=2055 RepID=A0A2I1R8A0_9ACTN|nr:DUF6054 family protein [Gordonia terrae]PKZ65336.1 hypothetical protein CYJ73_11685 [Gordonia terrae]